MLKTKARDRNYLKKYNKKENLLNANNKIIFKRIASKHNILTPKNISIIKKKDDLRKEIENIKKTDIKYGFVVKPASGYSGNGVTLINKFNSEEQTFITSKNETLNYKQILIKAKNILQGRHFYSNRNQDKIIIEQRIKPFIKVINNHISDIRIVSFLGFPVMAMLRIANKNSQGLSNINKGGIGIAINIKTGDIMHDNLTSKIVSERQIPNWDKLLKITTSCHDAYKLGYIAADFIIDNKLNPILIEINSRPGLKIQQINNKSLSPRLKKIEKIIKTENLNNEQKISIAKKYF